MTLKNQNLGIVLAVCLAACILNAGCLGTSSLFSKTGASPEPETGIASWIAAVNSHDYDHIYDLAPQFIRDQVSRSDFIQVQRDNPLLAPGNVIKGYTVVNKTISGNNAAITVQLVLHIPAAGKEPARDIPLYIKFVEVYENEKWTVWTTEP